MMSKGGSVRVNVSPLVAKLQVFNRGSKTYIPKIFYRAGRLKTYIPKNLYTKTTYITLLSKKFNPPPHPTNATPLVTFCYLNLVLFLSLTGQIG
ncbi:hypothetical protein Hanom_Chr08g00757701 [Helianthus anomalus]